MEYRIEGKSPCYPYSCSLFGFSNNLCSRMETKNTNFYRLTSPLSFLTVAIL